MQALVLQKKKKSIFIFLGSLTGGGAERVASTLSKYLSGEKNYNITLVTLGTKKRDFYELDENVNRIALNLDGETAGFNKILSNIKRVARFRKLLKKKRPDLVIAFMTRYAVITLLASVFLNVRVIVSERNYPPKRTNHTMWEILRKYVYKFADLHIVQTELIGEWIKEKTKSDFVKIIPNSITLPLPVYDPVILPKQVVSRKDKIILAAGTFKHQKGFDLLLKSASVVLKEKPEWKLVILGDEKNGSGCLTRQFENYIHEKRLNDRIILPGRAGNVGHWYDLAEIFVLSSRYEGFPNVLLEAMAAGCACISFDCKTGPAEMIKHGENGILVPEDDIAELSNQLRFLIENEMVRNEISKNAKDVRNRFSEKNIMTKWKTAVESILNK